MSIRPGAVRKYAAEQAAHNRTAHASHRRFVHTGANATGSTGSPITNVRISRTVGGSPRTRDPTRPRWAPARAGRRYDDPRGHGRGGAAWWPRPHEASGAREV